MEAEERPSKKRRLTDPEDSLLPEVEDVPSTSTKENGSFSNGHGQNAADRSDHESDREESAPTDLPNGHGESHVPPPYNIAPIVDAVNDHEADPPLSKNQQKKLQKKLDWESQRDERKVIRKQKLVAKRERKRAAREQALENGEPPPQPRSKPQKSALLPVTIVIDCDFDDLMRDPERKSLAAQITRSYSDNRKAVFKAHLAICSFGGMLRERFDTVLTHYKSWKGVEFLDCDFVEAAEKAKAWMVDPKLGGEMAGVFSDHASSSTDSDLLSRLQEEAEVVYLTSEAEDTLTELKPYSTYIIGGLVDKNREKGICYKRASKRGIKTAKLPIGEFLHMQSRKVLATNHVNEIMVRWLECGDWGEAFMKVIPKRKGGKLKEATDEGDTGEQHDLDEEEREEDDDDNDDDNDDDDHVDLYQELDEGEPV